MSSKEQAREEIDGKRHDAEKEKAYKEEVIKKDMIIPGDPTGSPDDLFFSNFGGIF